MDGHAYAMHISPSRMTIILVLKKEFLSSTPSLACRPDLLPPPRKGHLYLSALPCPSLLDSKDFIITPKLLSYHHHHELIIHTFLSLSLQEFSAARQPRTSPHGHGNGATSQDGVELKHCTLLNRGGPFLSSSAFFTAFQLDLLAVSTANKETAFFTFRQHYK